MKCLEYPFNAALLMKKKLKIRSELLTDGRERLSKRIAILGGSTTDEIKNQLELFLLDSGIAPTFYESEYNQFYQAAMFPNEELERFKPDIIYIHTSNRNILQYPTLADTEENATQLLQSEKNRFVAMWDRLTEIYHCPIVQNNFEMPFYRLLGNKEAVDYHGKINFINQLNQGIYQYAQQHNDFYVNDINYVSACYGLDKWSQPLYWHMYKYACCIQAIPYLSFNLAKIIKSIFGKNKKGYVLDLDNTLWGGVIGDDGVDNLVLGQETPMGQVYSEFQGYLKENQQLGIVLAIDSKNDESNALAGLSHPDSKLKKEDFVSIQANWESKDRNYLKIAHELNLLPESLVFVDDNPAERAIVTGQISDCIAPELDEVENYITVLDRSGFFEVTNVSKDDLKRNQMYQENAKRVRQQASFESYSDYLLSLQMHAEIKPFEPVYYARIAQLSNKSNQFNLTTKRYTQSEIEAIAQDPDYIKLYGKLIDKFGDNGVVSVIIGHKDNASLKIDLWIMSCRVLKREMEYAMMDALVQQCISQEVTKVYGYYYPTSKNAMVKDFYKTMGFELEQANDNGSTTWKFVVDTAYQNKQKTIQVN